MQLVMIGSGNVATILGRLMTQKGHRILQVISHTREHADSLAKELNAASACNLADINGDADVYLIAVADNVMAGVASGIRLPGKLVVHTAGSAATDKMSAVSDKCGVLWPIQSLRKEARYIPHIPFVVNGNNVETTGAIAAFAETLSDKVIIADDEIRTKLHVASVISSNFANHLYALAENYCNKEKIDFRALVPIIKETANRMEYYHPSDVQTGPAARGDTATIIKHLDMMATHPYLKRLYLKLTNSIMQMPGKK